MVKMEYILNDIPSVSFVLIVFQAWGRKDTVVQKAATRPAISIQFIL